MDISQDVKCLKGVGPKLLEKLNKCGIFSILDLLLYFPRDYEFLRSNIPFNEIDEEDKQVLSCICVGIDGDVRTKTGKVLTTIRLNYLGNLVLAKWFNQGFIKNTFKIGQSYDLMGKFKRVANRLEVINPIIGVKLAKENEIVPKYSLKGELSDKILIKLIGNCLEQITINDNLPKYLLEKYKMTSLDFAIKNIHFPSGKRELELAINRLKFQELFTYSMKLLMLKKNLRTKNGIEFKLVDELRELKMALPYSLTEAQTRVVREILRDQKSPWPMNRLVQGDVGSGKTVLALIAMFNVVKNRYQATLMVPTEILANQHYLEAKKLLEPFNIHIELLTGSTPMKEKRRIKELISTDEPLIVIGTHALIQEQVEYANLALVITDEQHRFGVRQREALASKGKQPHVLVMSATPIPRTLAIILYGDLDISVIDELPANRLPIKNCVVDTSYRPKAYRFIENQVELGRQVYVICPMVEESETIEAENVTDYTVKLQQQLRAGIRVACLNGKMKQANKQEIMEQFSRHEIDVLVSTTVIEVGINVPNATVMMVENAERFGLAQLHQLRGRVGRGGFQSYCIFMSGSKKQETMERLSILNKSNDGFFIANEDLRLRGPGDFFGIRQSGILDFVLADVYDHADLLKMADDAIKWLIKQGWHPRELDSEKFKKKLEGALQL